MVPLRGSTTIGCKIIGDAGFNSKIVWSRDSLKFRDGSYSVESDSIHLENVAIEDAGYYYCRANGPDGQTKTSSIQVQVRISYSSFKCKQKLHRFSFPLK